MADAPKDALATYIANIEAKTGKTLKQLNAALKKSGLEKHAELVAWAKQNLDLGHGHANALVMLYRNPEGLEKTRAGGESGDVLGDIYQGKKEHLRPIHEKLMQHIGKLGDFETAPKKGYVSLRRKKQFATLGPKTNDRFELGLNLKEDIGTTKVVAQKPGGMCQYVVAMTSPKDIDKEVLAAVKKAYDAAG
ncbi:MAG: DUF4287 domain-containing protein [Hyphomonadaceae bacterium]